MTIKDVGVVFLTVLFLPLGLVAGSIVIALLAALLVLTLPILSLGMAILFEGTVANKFRDWAYPGNIINERLIGRSLYAEVGNIVLGTFLTILSWPFTTVIAAVSIVCFIPLAVPVFMGAFAYKAADWLISCFSSNQSIDEAPLVNEINGLQNELLQQNIEAPEDKLCSVVPVNQTKSSFEAKCDEFKLDESFKAQLKSMGFFNQAKNKSSSHVSRLNKICPLNEKELIEEKSSVQNIM